MLSGRDWDTAFPHSLTLHNKAISKHTQALVGTWPGRYSGSPPDSCLCEILHLQQGFPDAHIAMADVGGTSARLSPTQALTPRLRL